MCARLVQEVGLLRLEVGFYVTGRVSGGSRRGNACGHVKPDRETREADFSRAARIPCVACCSEVLDTGRDDYVHVHAVVVRVECGERRLGSLFTHPSMVMSRASSRSVPTLAGCSCAGDRFFIVMCDRAYFWVFGS